MTYEYRCGHCSYLFEVIKSVREMDEWEPCPDCKTPSERVFIPRPLYFSGTKVENPEYNPGLGCIVKSKSHRKEIAKQKGLIEIGNETPETIHKYYDKKRTEKLESAWNEVDRGWVGNGE